MAGRHTHRPSPTKRLREVFHPERAELWTIVLYLAAVGVLSLIVPVTTQALVNTAGFGTVLQPVFVLTLVVLVALGAAALLRMLQVAVAERIQQRLFARMAIDIAHRLARVRLDAFDTSRGTELVNRFFDVVTIQKSTALILLDGLALVLQTVIGMVLLALYHPLLLGFGILLLGAMLFVVFGLGRGTVRTSIDESFAKYDVVAWLEELARTPLAFRESGGARVALRHADAVTVEYLRARQSHFRLLFRQIGGTLAVQALGSASLLGLGGWLVARQQLTLGQLVAAELIVTPAVAGFAKLGKYLETFYELLAGVDKVGHLFELPLERAHGERLRGGPGGCAVKVNAVDYERGGRMLLASVQLDVAAGERIAILGGSGGGKSLLADLLTGHRAPTRGTVRVDGVDLREVAPDSLRDRAALVRSADLFDGTLRDNLLLDRPGVEPSEIMDVLERLGLRDDVEALPAGLDSRTRGQWGALSTGQCIRLALARAILGRPGLLVIDELIDGLDEQSTQRALELLAAPSASWTLVFLTRRPELAARLPRVLRIEAGRLAEEVRS